MPYPFFHVYGMTVAMSLAIYLGAQLVIVPNPRPIDGVMKVIDKETPTVPPACPRCTSGSLTTGRGQVRFRKPVKGCISGAVPSCRWTCRPSLAASTGGRLAEGYGLTEAVPVSHCNPIYGQRKAGSIGLPFPDVEAKIMDYDKFVEKSQGEEGELWLRGPADHAGLLG